MTLFLCFCAIFSNSKRLYFNENNISENLKVVLAVDAFSVKSNLIVEENEIVRETINEGSLILFFYFR